MHDQEDIGAGAGSPNVTGLEGKVVADPRRALTHVDVPADSPAGHRLALMRIMI